MSIYLDGDRFEERWDNDPEYMRSLVIIDDCPGEDHGDDWDKDVDTKFCKDDTQHRFNKKLYAPLTMDYSVRDKFVLCNHDRRSA